MPDLFSRYFPLRPHRAHEVTGAGATVFAAICCGLGKKGATWVMESWQSETLNPVGFGAYCDPAKLIVVNAPNATDVQAASEEALRSGAVSTVVAELTQPLSFTAGRRLQLAAETGKSTGVFIISDGAGSNSAETRWRCAPVFDQQGRDLQQWELIKNKSGTLAKWPLCWDASARRMAVVAKAPVRSQGYNLQAPQDC